MVIQSSIQNSISEVLLGVRYDQLTPLWQLKVDETVDKLMLEVIKPLRLMNIALFETEQQLQQENKKLKRENEHIRTLIKVG